METGISLKNINKRCVGTENDYLASLKNIDTVISLTFFLRRETPSTKIGVSRKCGLSPLQESPKVAHFSANKNEGGRKNQDPTSNQRRAQRNQRNRGTLRGINRVEPLPLGSLAEPQRDDEPGDMQSSRKGSTREGSELTRRAELAKLTAETKRERASPR